MGQLTHFEISTLQGPSIQEIFKKETKETFSAIGYVFDEEGYTKENEKWYDHELDMIELSKRYPDVIFSLRGENEQQEVWYKTFTNGVKISETNEA